MSEFNNVIGQSIRNSSPIKSVLYEFKILWDGWEMDNDGAVVELEDGTKKLLSTDHGGLCFISTELLQGKVSEYMKMVDDYSKAIKVLMS